MGHFKQAEGCYESQSQFSNLSLHIGCELGACVAHAAKGYTITPDQAEKVTPGMTADEVQQTLGPAALVEKFRNEPGGPTWTYRILANGTLESVLNVDSSSNGQVASVSQREAPLN